jgi:hypothetical protein
MTTKTYEAGSRIGDRIIRVQELKAQINALEAELDSEKAYLLAHAENHEFQCLQCGPTKLSRRERIVWTISRTGSARGSSYLCAWQRFKMLPLVALTGANPLV